MPERITRVFVTPPTSPPAPHSHGEPRAGRIAAATVLGVVGAGALVLAADHYLNKDDLSKVHDAIETPEAALASLKTQVDQNTTQIDTNSAAIATNSALIATDQAGEDAQNQLLTDLATQHAGILAINDEQGNAIATLEVTTNDNTIFARDLATQVATTSTPQPSPTHEATVTPTPEPEAYPEHTIPERIILEDGESIKTSDEQIYVVSGYVQTIEDEVMTPQYQEGEYYEGGGAIFVTNKPNIEIHAEWGAFVYIYPDSNPPTIEDLYDYAQTLFLYGCQDGCEKIDLILDSANGKKSSLEITEDALTDIATFSDMVANAIDPQASEA